MSRIFAARACIENGFCRKWQINAERRAVAKLALHVDRASALLHDPIHGSFLPVLRRQAASGPVRAGAEIHLAMRFLRQLIGQRVVERVARWSPATRP